MRRRDADRRAPAQSSSRRLASAPAVHFGSFSPRRCEKTPKCTMPKSTEMNDPFPIRHFTRNNKEKSPSSLQGRRKIVHSGGFSHAEGVFRLKCTASFKPKCTVSFQPKCTISEAGGRAPIRPIPTPPYPSGSSILPARLPSPPPAEPAQSVEPGVPSGPPGCRGRRFCQVRRTRQAHRIVQPTILASTMLAKPAESSRREPLHANLGGAAADHVRRIVQPRAPPYPPGTSPARSFPNQEFPIRRKPARLGKGDGSIRDALAKRWKVPCE